MGFRLASAFGIAHQLRQQSIVSGFCLIRATPLGVLGKCRNFFSYQSKEKLILALQIRGSGEMEFVEAEGNLCIFISEYRTNNREVDPDDDKE